MRVCDGCGKAVRSVCVECHKKARAKREIGRPSAHARGYGARWRKLRKLVLHDDPICAVCCVQASQEVDHVLPKGSGGMDALSNLQGICERCHAEKTAQENSTRFNAQATGNLGEERP
jgi:5-methylcytosine-specific restriction protein A